MHVVLDSSRSQNLESVLQRDAAHVRPNARLQIFRYGIAPIFRGKDDMIEQAGIGHGRDIVASQPSLRDYSRFPLFPGISCRAIGGSSLRDSGDGYNAVAS